MRDHEHLLEVLKSGNIADVLKNMEIHKLVGYMRWSEMIWIQKKLKLRNYDPGWRQDARQRIAITKQVIQDFYPVYQTILQFFGEPLVERTLSQSELLQKLRITTSECLRTYDELHHFISKLESML